ncbi:MAG TPA: GvpL/GvpF family gas vesicle protein [Vicinamibacterales bacterium]|nr:GvpL/GvpF family gas vesicle protein [Vicinamibacterales bacterium]
MKTATYAYCVVKRGRRPSLARLRAAMPGGAAPRAVRGPGNTWVIVSDVPLRQYGSAAINRGLKRLDWVAERALAHEAVVESCARLGDVIPLKLFTIFNDDRSAVSHVGSARALGSVFRKIAGCSEWSVRMMCAPAAGAQPGRTGSRARRGSESGTSFLLRKRTERETRRKAAASAARAVEDAYRRLARVARAAVRREGDVPATSLMLDAAFLVPRSRQAMFAREASALARRASAAGCELVLSGPWPAYHFVAGA